MIPGSNTESYPAFAHIGLRENPRKNINQSLMLAGSEFQSLGRAIVKEDEYEEVRWDGFFKVTLVTFEDIDHSINEKYRIPDILSLPSKETLRGHSDSSFRGECYIQCCVGVRLCDMYSNQELAEIHFMYGKADGNAALARRLYQ
ncbi:hypothetical protein ANN_04499 [Periplaneta americana]|uniref:Uncharacterized protein n=1 Tax=Periplaneta americana TaxID=6978 RepID=A0ABQ8TB48_PERAM|nr:hypothetical protein ANN_04499 [Periplaneta americana]